MLLTVHSDGRKRALIDFMWLESPYAFEMSITEVLLEVRVAHKMLEREVVCITEYYVMNKLIEQEYKYLYFIHIES